MKIPLIGFSEIFPGMKEKSKNDFFHHGVMHGPY
jgi:hypothetical protein